MSHESSEESGGLDLSHVTEIPGGDAFQKAITDFNKKAAGAAWNAFKRHLGTVTEPFFRAGMGERYYTRETQNYGIQLWIVGTLIAYYGPHFWLYLRNGASPICAFLHFPRLADFFWHPVFAIVTGGLMVLAQYVFGNQNLRLMARYRNEGAAYHTRSRGISRWGTLEVSFFVVLLFMLLMFNLPVAVLFMLGCAMNAKLKSEQDAAILSRYQDAMDAHVENEYLHDAALGKCPTEIAYLYRPISDKWKPEVRNNIADALVGRPVSGLVQQRQRKGSAQGGSGPRTPAPRWSQQTAGGPSQTTDTTSQSLQTPAGIANRQARRPEPIPSISPSEDALKSAFQAAKGTAAETLASILRSKRLIRFAVIGLILVAVGAVATPAVRFIHARLNRPADVAATEPVQPPKTSPILTAAPAPVATPAPDIKSAEEKSNFEARVQAAVDALRRQDAEKAAAALEAQKREEQAKEQAALEAQKRQEAERLAALEIQKQQEKERAAAFELQKKQEAAKMVEQIKTALADQETQRAKLLADCETRLASNTNKIAKVATASRKSNTYSSQLT